MRAFARKDAWFGHGAAFVNSKIKAPNQLLCVHTPLEFNRTEEEGTANVVLFPFETTYTKMHILLEHTRKLAHDLCSLPSGQALTTLQKRSLELSLQVKRAVETGNIDSISLEAIYAYVHSVRVLAEAASRSEVICQDSREALRNQIADCLAKPASEEVQQQCKTGMDDESVNYDIWRQWYSDHIAHPYYDSNERDWLLKQIPGMTPQKMQTWFVNVRRRSGWSELYKKYADNKRENMEAIFKACDDPDPEMSKSVAPEARKLVAKIKQYLMLESKKTQIEPWLSDLLDKYKQKALKSTQASAIKHEEDERKPAIASSAGKNRNGKTQKRKASDENEHNTSSSKRSKPSLYKVPHHPPSSPSTLSSFTASKALRTPSFESLSLSSSSPTLELLQTPPSAHNRIESNGSEQYIIPPFSAWTPPQPAHAVQSQQPLSAFVPSASAQTHHAQAYQHLPQQHHAQEAHSMLQLQAPGQSFTAQNNITYNIATSPLYAYAQPVMQFPNQADIWSQAPPWTYATPPQPLASYTLSPTAMNLSQPSLVSNYSMLSSLASTHPGKRKYNADEEDLPPTPTGWFKKGRMSVCTSSGAPSVAEVIYSLALGVEAS